MAEIVVNAKALRKIKCSNFMINCGIKFKSTTNFLC